MPTPLNSTAASTFMVVATIRDDANLAELGRLRAEEQKQLLALQSAGRVGAHHLARARQTVFLEVKATDEEHVLETIATLPFAAFFDVDIFATNSPDVTAGPQS